MKQFVSEISILMLVGLRAKNLFDHNYPVHMPSHVNMYNHFYYDIKNLISMQKPVGFWPTKIGNVDRVL